MKKIDYREGEGINFTELNKEGRWRALAPELLELWKRRDGIGGERFTEDDKARLKKIKTELGRGPYSMLEFKWTSQFVSGQTESATDIAQRVVEIQGLSWEEINRELESFNAEQRKRCLPTREEIDKSLEAESGE